VDFDLFTTFTVDEASVGGSGANKWLDAHITVATTSFDTEFDVALVCSGNNRVGKFVSAADTPSPVLPVTEPLPRESVTEGYVSLGLPKADDGTPVEACTPGRIGIVGLSDTGGSSDFITVPEDLAAELVE
jgi:hypothetical protein